jgi:hypothetical protein
MKGGSYFNEDQQDYMRELARTPPEQLCYCGWYRLGQCPHAACRTSGKSAADKLAEAGSPVGRRAEEP